MSFNDPIAELLTNMRNAISAKHRFVDLRLSKMRLGIIQILKEQGFVDSFLLDKENKKLRIFFKYKQDRLSVISGLKRVSSPGLRKYVSCVNIPKILGGMGIAVLSTPKGVMDGETARAKEMGGELLCYIW